MLILRFFLRLHRIISLENFEYSFTLVLNIVQLLDSIKQCTVNTFFFRRRIQLEKVTRKFKVILCEKIHQ
jgi:hypothetical protein